MADGTDRELKYTSQGNGTFPTAARRAKQQAFAKAGMPTPAQYMDTGNAPVAPDNQEQFATLINSLLAGEGEAAGGGGGAQIGGSAAPSSASDYSGMPFGKAFRTARNAGLDQFMWNGKPYTTQLAEEVPGEQEGDMDADDPMSHNRGYVAPNPKGKSNPGIGTPQPLDTVQNSTMSQNEAMGGDIIPSILEWLGIGGAAAGAAGGAAYGVNKAAKSANAADAAAPTARADATTRSKDVAEYSAPERKAYKAIQAGDFATAEQVAKNMEKVDPEAAAAIRQIAKNARGATGIPKGIASALKALGL